MLNRRSFLETTVRSGMLAMIPGVSTSFLNDSPFSSTSAPWNIFIHTDPTRWPLLQPHILPGDMIWSDLVGGIIPQAQFTWEFTNYATLSGATDTKLARYSGLHLDGEYSNFQQAFNEAPQIRSFVDAYNRRHPTTKLRYQAYYHTSIIDAYPTIVQYPDITSIGSSRWQSSPQAIQTRVQPYVDLIRNAGRTPAVRLCDYVSHLGRKTTLTVTQLAAQIHAVVDPAPNGLGLSGVEGYYFFGTKSTPWPDALIAVRG